MSPLLFLLFLNDLPFDISDCNIMVYADDVKLFYTFDDDHGQAVLQRNIDLFVTWCRTNLMDLTSKRVLFGNALSRTLYLTSGVPQGSHLDYLLFLLFLNDLPCSVSDCNILMYSHDVKLFYTFDCDHVQAVLQRNIGLFVT